MTKRGNTKRKLYLILALLVALAVTGGTFAYTQVSSTVAPTTSFAGVAGGFATISTDEPISGGDYATGNATPTWSPVVDVADAITAGDLYYIDVGTYTGDILVTLYLDNPNTLAKCYSYINMAICVYGVTYADSVADGFTITGVAAGVTGTIACSPGSVSIEITTNTDGLTSVSGNVITFGGTSDAVKILATTASTVGTLTMSAAGSETLTAVNAGITGGLSPDWTFNLPATGSYSWNSNPISTFYTDNDSSGTFTTGDTYNYYSTLTSGYVSFVLKRSETCGATLYGTSHAYYAITVNDGAQCCIYSPTDAELLLGTHSLSPNFYISVRQA